MLSYDILTKRYRCVWRKARRIYTVSVHKDVFSYERLVATSVMEAAAFSLSKVYKSDAGKVDVNTHPLMPVHRFTVVNLDSLDDLIDHLRRKCFHTGVFPESCQQ